MSSDSDHSDVEESPQKRVMESDSDSAPSHRSTSPKKSTVLDSDSDEDVKTKKKAAKVLDSDESDQEVRTKVVQSDSDEDDGPKVKVSDVFGQDVSSSEDEGERVRRPSGSDAEKSDDSIHGIRMHNPEDDDEMEPEEEKEKEFLVNTNVDECYVRPNLGDGPHFVKMPNFLSMQVHPFDAEQYEEDELDEQLKVDDEGNQRLKLRVENTIRWRKTQKEDGTEVQESNAKFVKWSDGTMSLYLGNEIFEVTVMPIHANHQPHLYVNQSGSMSAQSIIDKNIKFRPHSTDSKTHRKVTLNMVDRTRKSAQVKVMDELRVNPDIARRAAAKKEEEEIRAAMRKSTQMRKAYRPAKYNSRGYDEDDIDEPRRRKEAPLIGVSDSEDEDTGRRSRHDDRSSDSDAEHRKKKSQQKKRIDTSDEESD